MFGIAMQWSRCELESRERLSKYYLLISKNLFHACAIRGILTYNKKNIREEDNFNTGKCINMCHSVKLKLKVHELYNLAPDIT